MLQKYLAYLHLIALYLDNANQTTLPDIMNSGKSFVTFYDSPISKENKARVLVDNLNKELLDVDTLNTFAAFAKATSKEDFISRYVTTNSKINCVIKQVDQPKVTVEVKNFRDYWAYLNICPWFVLGETFNPELDFIPTFKPDFNKKAV